MDKPGFMLHAMRERPHVHVSQPCGTLSLLFTNTRGLSTFMGLRPGLFHPPSVVFFGPAARALFGKGSFRPPGGVFSWACGPRFFALRASCLRRGTFCSPKKFLKNGSLRWPCGALRLTRNPLGAFLLRAHQRGSRDTVQNMRRVSSNF